VEAGLHPGKRDVAMQQFPTGPATRPWVERVAGWWQWIPLPLCAVYLLSILVKFKQLIVNTYLSADFASAPVIGELYGGSPAHRQVVLGSMAWFSTLMFELATRWLPLHREIWEAAPYAMALASAALVAWGASRVAGRRGALVAAAIVLCAGPRTLYWLFALNDHAPSWLCLTLLAAALVALEQRPAWLSTRVLIPVLALIGAVVGVNAASDPLVIVGAVVPLLFACAAVWALRPTRASALALAWALACTAVAGVCYALTRALMHHENVVIAPNLPHNKLASPETSVSNVALWWQSLTRLGSGDFYSQTLGLSSGLRLICAVLTLIAVATILPLTWRVLSRTFSARDRDADGQRPGDSLRLATGAVEQRAMRCAWCVFWATSATAISVSYVFSANPEGSVWSSRYLVGVIYAAAALLAVLMRGERLVRLAVIAGVSVFALNGIVSLWNGLATENTSNFPSTTLYGQVANAAAREHLSYGYAGYWDAAPITWGTHMRVQVYPLAPCNGDQLCEFNLHYITSWYTPRPHTRSFLLYDPTQPAATPAMSTLGKPSAEIHLQGPVVMYVYPYDIASKLAAAS
jgi:hypothetical protein